MASLVSKLATPFLLLMVAQWGQVGPALAADPSPLRLDFSGPGMGTTFRIALYTTPEKKTLAEVAVASALQRLAALNTIFSDYEPNSEINRLAAASPAPWTASPDLLALTRRSLYFAEETQGAFDPTIGQLSRLWRSSRQRQKLAPLDRLQKARSSSGWQHLQIHNKTLTLAQPGLLLDFGGIAKGYAADQMLAILKGNGFPIALVQAGGDTAAGDAPPSQSGWPITLLTDPNDPSPVKISLANRSVSTSGDLHQFIELDGIRYSHIIDPQTGLGLTRRIACSVIAPDTTTSDALATALCILGPEQGRPIARNLKLTVRWTWQDEAGAKHQAWFNP